MKARVVGAALALIGYVSAPTAIVAKGGPGGRQSGGGHPSGHSSGGHPSSGHPGSAHATGGQSPSTTPGRSEGRVTAPAGGGTPPITRALARDRHPNFLVTPSTYAPHFVSPLFGAYGIAVRPYGDSGDADSTCDGLPGCAAPPAGYDRTSGPQGSLAIISGDDTGDVRVDVRPAGAQVFVDDVLVGTVDDYLHILGGLNLHAGRHRLEFRARGFEALVADIDVVAGHITTYRGDLQPRQH